MTARSVVIHGHFYQPPRENPWLDEVEAERRGQRALTLETPEVITIPGFGDITRDALNRRFVDAEPVIDQGRVYAVGQGGRMASYELVSGQRLWEINIAGISTPAIAGD